MFEPDLKKLDLKQRDFVSLEHAARRRFGPHRRAQGGQARRAEVALPGPRGLGRRHPVRPLPRRRCWTSPTSDTGKTVYQWMVESFRKLEALPPGSAEAAKPPARRCAPRSTRSCATPIRARSSASGCARRWRREFGRGLQRRRVHPHRHQRRGPARLHRRRPQPDAVQHRRLRQHRQGHHRGLGLALYPARLGLAAVAHEGPGARLSGGDAAAHRALRHLRA